MPARSKKHRDKDVKTDRPTWRRVTATVITVKNTEEGNVAGYSTCGYLPVSSLYLHMIE